MPIAPSELTITVPHSLGSDAAQRRIAARLAAVQIRGTWQGLAFTITQPAQGTLTVSPTEVRIVAKLGPSMAMLRQIVEARLRSELTAALTP